MFTFLQAGVSAAQACRRDEQPAGLGLHPRLQRGPPCSSRRGSSSHTWPWLSSSPFYYPFYRLIRVRNTDWRLALADDSRLAWWHRQAPWH
ncbi:MAG: hypothetical protein MZV63_04450 [Marinilabiliales bacterium]|nr:hypothetical protein [Marinilabiliales bacterium]